MAERVLAVVVSYNPEVNALRVLLQATLAQLDAVVLVDNASGNIEAIRSLAKDVAKDNTDKSVGLLEQPNNLGLGAAHNIGIDAAKQQDFDYVLLLDQDSVPLTDMVSKLLHAQQTKSQQQKVSATGVTYLNADNGSESFFVRFGVFKFKRQYCAERDQDGCIEADFLISSGSLISLTTLDEIGVMDESLFIDHIDTEWFLRARSQGYQAYGVCDAMMQHGLGETTHQLSVGTNFFLRRVFGLRNARQRNVPQHNPFRYYYIFRNSILLYKRGYADIKWKWNDLQRLAMVLLMFGVIKGPRQQNLSMMWRGIKDGLRGVSGKLAEL